MRSVVIYILLCCEESRAEMISLVVWFSGLASTRHVARRVKC